MVVVVVVVVVVVCEQSGLFEQGVLNSSLRLHVERQKICNINSKQFTPLTDGDLNRLLH